MSHNIRHYEYPESVDQKRVQRELDSYVAHEDWGEGASGLPRPIRWVNKVYDSREAADAAIEEADKTVWYNCMAVKFNEYPSPAVTKELAELRKRAADAQDAVQRTIDACSVKRRTSEFIGCPECKSSLKRELLRGELCPLCRAELRSKTSLDRIDAARKKAADLNGKAREKEEALARKNKPAVKWLVKIEYHT